MTIYVSFGGVVVRSLAFHLNGSEFDPLLGGLEPSPHVKSIVNSLVQVIRAHSNWLKLSKEKKIKKGTCMQQTYIYLRLPN